jgi:hypothetical protein
VSVKVALPMVIDSLEGGMGSSLGVSVPVGEGWSGCWDTSVGKAIDPGFEITVGSSPGAPVPGSDCCWSCCDASADSAGDEDCTSGD